MLIYPIPENLDGSALKVALEAVGYTGVGVVVSPGSDNEPGVLRITVNEAEPAVYTQDDIDEAVAALDLEARMAAVVEQFEREKREAVQRVTKAAQDRADVANAALHEKIAAIVADYPPLPPSSEPSALDRLAEAVGVSTEVMAEAITQAQATLGTDPAKA